MVEMKIAAILQFFYEKITVLLVLLLLFELQYLGNGKS